MSDEDLEDVAGGMVHRGTIVDSWSGDGGEDPFSTSQCAIRLIV